MKSGVQLAYSWVRKGEYQDRSCTIAAGRDGSQHWQDLVTNSDLQPEGEQDIVTNSCRDLRRLRGKSAPWEERYRTLKQNRAPLRVLTGCFEDGDPLKQIFLKF